MSMSLRGLLSSDDEEDSKSIPLQNSSSCLVEKEHSDKKSSVPIPVSNSSHVTSPLCSATIQRVSDVSSHVKPLSSAATTHVDVSIRSSHVTPSLSTAASQDVSNRSLHKTPLSRAAATQDVTNQHSTKSWLKGQVSKISTKISPSSSLNTSSIHSVDDSSSLPPRPVELNFTSKVLSETDLPSLDVKDGGSMSHKWLKNQMSNYYFKPRENRNSVPENAFKNLLEKKLNVLDSSHEKHASLPEISTIDVDSSTHMQPYESVLNLSSVSSSYSHLPVWQSEQATTTAIGKNTVCNTVTNKNTFLKSEKYGSPLSPTASSKMTSRLKFSDLLHANISASPNDSTEEIAKQDIIKNISSTDGNPAKNSLYEDDEIFTEISIDHLTDKIVKEDLKNHMGSNTDANITFYNLWVASIFCCSYFLFPFPPFLSGVVSGSIGTYLVGCVLIWMLSPSSENYIQYREDLRSYLIEEVKQSQKPDVKKGCPKPEVLRKPRDLKSWMCMAYMYNNTFEAKNTKDVYLVIHEETLLVYVSKKKLDTETAELSMKKKTEVSNSKLKTQSHSESLINFEKEIKIDLSKCHLYLKPDDLPIRRIWNKKYPIKLISPCTAIQRRNINFSLEELTLSLNGLIESLDFVDVGHIANQSKSKSEEASVIYLFANTGREKEDWFYRMQLCISSLKHQVTFKDIRQHNLSDHPSSSYAHYMVDLIAESEKVMQRNVNGKKIEPFLAWLNVFLGRTFWDFWHDKYWTDKLHQKIQSRLSKLNTPPFITDIRLTDLNCGHNVPIIHKGSVPVLDEYGVWTDLQITYKGHFTLTLETQLNVDYYVALVSGIMKQKTAVKDNYGLSKMTKLSEITNENIDEIPSHEVDDPSEMMADAIPDVYFDAFDHVDGSNAHGMLDPIMTDPRTKAFLESRTGKKVVSLVGWLAKSKLAKKVAETDFAKKAYEKAYEKFRKMPIILKVEIQSLKGNLAVNIPPPPTNRLWFGFRNNPVIFITASPKVGDKQVRLTYLTSWIEKKLKEEFKKYLVLPSMQDISIKLMDAQLKDLHPEKPTS